MTTIPAKKPMTLAEFERLPEGPPYPLCLRKYNAGGLPASGSPPVFGALWKRVVDSHPA